MLCFRMARRSFLTWRVGHREFSVRLLLSLLTELVIMGLETRNPLPLPAVVGARLDRVFEDILHLSDILEKKACLGNL